MADYASLLRDHVTLKCRCIDRVFLQAYVPKLQSVGQVCTFLRWIKGFKIPSSAAFGKIGQAYVKAIHRFAEEHNIPVVHFKKGENKEEMARPYLEAAAKEGQERVVLIGNTGFDRLASTVSPGSSSKSIWAPKNGSWSRSRRPTPGARRLGPVPCASCSIGSLGPRPCSGIGVSNWVWPRSWTGTCRRWRPSVVPPCRWVSIWSSPPSIGRSRGAASGPCLSQIQETRVLYTNGAAERVLSAMDPLQQDLANVLGLRSLARKMGTTLLE